MGPMKYTAATTVYESFCLHKDATNTKSKIKRHKMWLCEGLCFPQSNVAFYSTMEVDDMRSVECHFFRTA